MVTITCQESGLQFEAATARTKQHPRIAELKAWGNKQQKYREVNDALVAVRKAGGYTTIDEYMALAQKHIDGVVAAARARHDRAAAEERADAERRDQAKRERQARNTRLNAAGYTWRKDAIGTEESWAPGGYGAGIGEFSHYEYTLVAPDGREINEAAALRIINSELTLEAYRAEQEQAQREADATEAAKAAAKEAEDNARDGAIRSFDQALATVKAEAVEVEYFKRPAEFVVAAKVGYHGGGNSYRAHDELLRCEINGVTCWYAVTGSGYDDDGYVSCYSSDPERAGLTRKAAQPASEDRGFF